MIIQIWKDKDIFFISVISRKWWNHAHKSLFSYLYFRWDMYSLLTELIIRHTWKALLQKPCQGWGHSFCLHTSLRGQGGVNKIKIHTHSIAPRRALHTHFNTPIITPFNTPLSTRWALISHGHWYALYMGAYGKTRGCVLPPTPGPHIHQNSVKSCVLTPSTSLPNFNSLTPIVLEKIYLVPYSPLCSANEWVTIKMPKFRR